MKGRIADDYARRLKKENDRLRGRLAETEETLRAIRNGDVDAVVVNGRRGKKVYSLQNAENLYRRLAETIREPTLALDAEGHIIFFNERAQELLGSPTKRIAGQNVSELIHPEDRKSFLVMLRRVTKLGTAQGRSRIKSTHGRAFSVYWRANSLERDEGRVICLVGADLTQLEASKQTVAELKQQQEELLATQAQLEVSRERYAELYDYAPVGYFTLDRNGVIHRANVTAGEMLGRDRSQLIGSPLLIHLAVADRRSFQKHLSRARRSLSPVTSELRFKTRNGGELAAQMTSVRNPDPGETGFRLRVALTDITAQQLAEAAFQAKGAELQLIADITKVMLVRCSRDMRFLFVNRASAEAHGLPPEQIVGKTVREIMGDEAYKAVLPHIRKVLKGQTIEYETELTYHRSGRRSIHVTYVPERSEQGEVTGWVAAITDITERKREEQWLHIRDAVNAELAVAPTLREAAPRILQVLCKQIGCDAGALWLADPVGAEMYCLNFWQCADTPMPEFERVTRQRRCARGNGLAGKVWRTGEPVAVPDVLSNPDFQRTGEACQNGLRSAFCSPIRLGKEVLGVLEGYTRQPREFENGFFHLLTALGDKLGHFIKRIRAEESLRQNENRMRRILNTALDAIITIDANGNIISWNPQAAHIFGWPEKETIGRNLANIVIAPRYRSAYEQSLRHYVETGAGPMLERKIELTARHRGGHEFPVEAFITSLALDDHLAFCVFVRDISDRKQAEQRLATDLDAMIRLQHLSTLFVSEGNLEPVLGEIVEAAIAIAGSDSGNLQLLDPVSGKLKIAAQRGLPQWWLDHWTKASADQGTWGKALKLRKRVIVEDVRRSPIFAGTRALKIQLRAGVCAVQSTPLISRAGKPLGIFSTHYRTPQKPGEQALRLLDLLARQAADIIERSQAEEALRESHEKLETRVHQRTVELATANAKLNRALARMSDLYHRAPCGYHSVDRSGRFVDINDTALQWLGYTREELVGKRTVFDIQTPGSRKVGLASFRQLKKGEPVRDLQLEFVRRDGSVMAVSLNATAIMDDNGRMLRSRSAFVNVSDRVQAEQALFRSEARLQAILDFSPAIIFLKNTEGRYLLVNHKFEQAFKLDQERVLGRTDDELFPPNVASAFRANDRAVLDADRAKAFEEVAPYSDGNHVSVVVKFPLRDTRGQINALGGIAIDITARKQAEAALRKSREHYHELFKEAVAARRETQRLSSMVLQAQEKERQHISRELHDDVGQTLTAVSMALSGVNGNRAASEMDQLKLSQAQRMLQGVMVTLHDFARELRPSVLDELGLLSALRSTVQTTEERTGLSVNLFGDPSVEQLNSDQKLALFRIAQESLSNIEKHAQASNVEITLAKTSGGIAMTVTDDGKSFEAKSAHPTRRGRLGLLGMQERARLLNGKFTLRAKPGKGTIIRVEIPFKR